MGLCSNISKFLLLASLSLAFTKLSAQEVENVPYDSSFGTYYQAYFDALNELKPELEKAETKLDKLFEGWKEELDKRSQTIYELKLELDHARNSLSELELKLKSEKIKHLSEEVEQLREEIFGTDGKFLNAVDNLFAPYQIQLKKAIDNLNSNRLEHQESN